MNQRRIVLGSILAIIIAGISVSGLSIICMLPAVATNLPISINSNALNTGTSPNSSGGIDSGSSSEFVEATTSPVCGQILSGYVNLTANLACSGDGIIVGASNTVINMNGFSITGPGQESSRVGITVPNVDNVVINGPGSISDFQAGVLLTGANGFKINSVILSNNQVNVTGDENTTRGQDNTGDDGPPLETILENSGVEILGNQRNMTGDNTTSG